MKWTKEKNYQKILDAEEIKKYPWSDEMEIMTRICEWFDYVCRIFDNGRIVMEDSIIHNNNRSIVPAENCKWVGEDSCGHIEAYSLKNMCLKWLNTLKSSDYAESEFKEIIDIIESWEKPENETVKILLTCPNCGDSNWITRYDKETEGAFECAACGNLIFPEDMCSCTHPA